MNLRYVELSSSLRYNVRDNDNVAPNMNDDVVGPPSSWSKMGSPKVGLSS